MFKESVCLSEEILTTLTLKTSKTPHTNPPANKLKCNLNKIVHSIDRKNKTNYLKL